MGFGAASRIGAALLVRLSHRATAEGEVAVESKKTTKHLKKSKEDGIHQAVAQIGVFEAAIEIVFTGLPPAKEAVLSLGLLAGSPADDRQAKRGKMKL
jgi:hypothetical protein